MQQFQLTGKLALLAVPLVVSTGVLMIYAGSASPSFQLIVACAGVGVWGYVALCFHASLGQGIAALQQMVSAVCAGDLTSNCRTEGGDELACIGRDINAMTRRLSNVVSGIRSEAQLVAMAGDHLLASAHELSARTDEQARSLKETSHGMAAWRHGGMAAWRHW